MKKRKFSGGRFGEMKSLVSGLGWWVGGGLVAVVGCFIR